MQRIIEVSKQIVRTVKHRVSYDNVWIGSTISGCFGGGIYGNYLYNEESELYHQPKK